MSVGAPGGTTSMFRPGSGDRKGGRAGDSGDYAGPVGAPGGPLPACSPEVVGGLSEAPFTNRKLRLR